MGGPAIPTLTEAHQSLAGMMTPSIKGHIAEARSLFSARASKLASYKSQMRDLHRDERTKLDDRQSREWAAETRSCANRLPKVLKGIWHRITGQYQKVRAINEAEAKATQLRHAGERDRLTFRQLDQRAVLQGKIKALRAQQAALLVSLRRDLARFSEFSRGPERPLDESPGLSLRR